MMEAGGNEQLAFFGVTSLHKPHHIHLHCSDVPLSPDEAQIWTQLCVVSAAGVHPDAVACRLKLAAVTLACRDVMPMPNWQPEKEVDIVVRTVVVMISLSHLFYAVCPNPTATHSFDTNIRVHTICSARCTCGSSLTSRPCVASRCHKNWCCFASAKRGPPSATAGNCCSICSGAASRAR